LAISEKTRKILWARSGNRCVICKAELITEQETDSKLNIGEECHIISSKLKGPRHKPNLNDYDIFDNLILLCRNHHKEIDTLIDSFPEEILRYMKQNHENWVQKTLNKELDDNKNTEEIKFLVRISSGKELMNLLSNAMGYRVDYDNIISKDEADYIGSTLQTFIDYGEIISDLEIQDKINIGLEFDNKIKELDEKGYFIFGEKSVEDYRGVKNFSIATLLIKRKNSEEIIKVSLDEDR
jgi:hypothetical protein